MHRMEFKLWPNVGRAAAASFSAIGSTNTSKAILLSDHYRNTEPLKGHRRTKLYIFPYICALKTCIFAEKLVLTGDGNNMRCNAYDKDGELKTFSSEHKSIEV